MVGDTCIKLDLDTQYIDGKLAQQELIKFLNNYWFNLQYIDFTKPENQSRLYTQINAFKIQKWQPSLITTFIQQLVFLYQRQTKTVLNVELSGSPSKLSVLYNIINKIGNIMNLLNNFLLY